MEKNRILFGKYRLIRQAGSGRTGTVWLAVHLGLEEYRAIKCVPKEHADYETFRKEALILKELHHPSIPVVYDLEEDQNCFYLIEEYLEGHSLYTLITHQGTLLEADAIRYGIQICSLVHFMHSSCEQPILHLDLQPKNLIICNGTVRLIDFDHAASSAQANACPQRYGTRGCAAPEQYTSDQKLDQRTDIYAIGAVLRFMVHGNLAPGEERSRTSEALETIIKKCMEADARKRFSSAMEVGEALQRLLSEPAADRKSLRTIPSLHIVLTGNRSGAGTTHLAFGLCCYLVRLGYKVLYEEHNPSGALRAFMSSKKLQTDRYGICHFRKCSLKPWYGPAACLPHPEGFEIILKDFGIQWKEARDELKRDRRVHVAAACESPWEKGQLDRLLEQTGILKEPDSRQTILVFRHMNRRRFRLSGFPGIRRTKEHFKNSFPVFGSPEYEDPFQPGREVNTFFEGLWEAVSGKTITNPTIERLPIQPGQNVSWELPEPEGEQE